MIWWLECHIIVILQFVSQFVYQEIFVYKWNLFFLYFPTILRIGIFEEREKNKIESWGHSSLHVCSDPQNRISLVWMLCPDDSASKRLDNWTVERTKSIQRLTECDFIYMDSLPTTSGKWLTANSRNNILLWTMQYILKAIKVCW